MASRALSVDAILFDVFGTMVDHDSALLETQAELGDGARELADLWRRKQLEYSWLRSLMNRPADFSDVTQDALDYALAALGLPGDWRDKMMASYQKLSAFDDVAPALCALADLPASLALRRAVLSNGSPAMLTSVLTSCAIIDHFEALISARDAGVFKPHPLVYQLACDRLHLDRHRLCLVSSNGWDIAGAAAFGFKTIWVNRHDDAIERLPARPDHIIRDLSALPALLGA
ncbi:MULTISPECIES: haloacid dehalogenase type II [unclassified Iodidimonas]|jgi:2-haloacid dehalogenase|uniref:haloacid dehalogenase type II n=1 Tax=unclassified Iodidimonas TaxID=2626145 RepID=UPI002482EB08|nr:MULTISPECIES: haloacid dehalogenase type II [unclassified Iodidimonas]